MRPRALVPSILAFTVLWPLYALACINSMDASQRDFGQFFFVDLALWSGGSVFLNRVVLLNVQGPAATGQPAPSVFRRGFFLFIGAALVLLVAMVSAGGPLLDFSAQDFATCSMNGTMLLAMVAAPALLFSLHGAFFHGMGRRPSRYARWQVVLALVLTSFVFVVGLWVLRDALILPKLCRAGTFSESGY